MKKNKNDSTVLQECAECANSTKHNCTLYCKLRLQDANIYTESAKVSRCECAWFKKGVTSE